MISSSADKIKITMKLLRIEHESVSLQNETFPTNMCVKCKQTGTNSALASSIRKTRQGLANVKNWLMTRIQK